jgi:hypothetical protein
MVLGRASHGKPLQWLSAVQLEAQLGITYKILAAGAEADDR